MLTRGSCLTALTFCAAALSASWARAESPKVTMSAGAIITSSQVLSEKAALAVLAGWRPVLKECYRAQVGKHKRLRGRVTLTFTVDRYGFVQKPKARGLKPVQPCMTQALRRIEFPKLKEAVDIRYSFTRARAAAGK